MDGAEWERIKGEVLFHDGTLRDIYVHGTGPADWERFLKALPVSPWEGSWLGDTTTTGLPETFEAARGARLSISIDIAGAALYCHFFTDEEIEFDLSPTEVNSPEKFEQLLGFMRWLANLLNKPVVLTPENLPDDALIEVTPAGSRI